MGKVLVALVFLASGRVFADEFDGKHALSSDERANIELDQDKAHQEIEERYKGDSSASARSSKMRELNDADSKVLQAHGSDDKAFLVQSMNTSPDQDKEVKSKKEEIKTKRESEAKAKEEAAKAPKEGGSVEIVKGFDDDHPIKFEDHDAAKKAPALDENGNAAPTIEKGFTEDEMAAKGDSADGAPKAEPQKDTEIAVPPTVEPGTEVIQAPSSP